MARRKLVKRLTSAFRNAGLETKMNRVPGFVNDYKVDGHMRKLVLHAAGLPESEFIRARPHLESNLQIFIDKVKSNVHRGTVELIYGYPKTGARSATFRAYI